MRSGRGRQVQEEPAQVTRGKPISNVVDKAGCGALTSIAPPKNWSS